MSFPNAVDQTVDITISNTKICWNLTIFQITLQNCQIESLIELHCFKSSISLYSNDQIKSPYFTWTFGFAHH